MAAINHSLLFIIIVLLPACNFMDTKSHQNDIFIPRYHLKPGNEEVHMEALLEGVLILQNRCPRIKSASGLVYTPIWSPEWTQRHQIIISDSTIMIFDHNVLKATLNESIKLGGGEVAHSNKINANIPRQCPPPYWLVGEWL